MYDPAQRDSRRGLKRTWSKASSKPGEAGSSSTTKEKISSKEKGEIFEILEFRRLPKALTLVFLDIIVKVFLGKSCPTSKAKKSKNKSDDPGEGSSGTKNPRMTSQSGNETDEDDLGQETVKPDSNCAKFCSNSCSQISSIIKTDRLIPHAMSDLRGLRCPFL